MYHCGEYLTDDAAGGGRGGRAAEVRSFIWHTLAHFRQGLFLEQHVRHHQRHGWMLVAVKILPKLKSRIKDTTTIPRPVMQATRQQQNGRECR